jgi:hypothetical protein
MIIGISGKIGSGKDTAAQIIMDLNPKFEKKSFAFKLKQIVALLTGTTLEDNLTQEGKLKHIDEFNMNLGKIQQVIGTQALRDSFDIDVWIKSLFVDYKQSNGEYPLWVISDVRFKNEANYIKKMGGILIRLEGDPSKVRENSNRDLNHLSETDLDNYDKFDYIYQNITSLEELKNFLLEAVFQKN